MFARRYGFRDKPLHIRFRILDPHRALLPTGGQQDITLDGDSFARLKPNISRVFITENEINFLSFPEVDDSMVIFGAGYGFAVLAPAHWLGHTQIHYWGDIDTHGFAILNSARTYLPHIQSLLMDEHTLLSHMELWGKVKQLLSLITHKPLDQLKWIHETFIHYLRKKSTSQFL